MQTVQHIHAPLTLPEKLRRTLPCYLDDALSRCGAPRAEELRLHRGRLCTVTCNGQSYATRVVLNQEEINGILRQMCGGSLYAYNQSICRGYLAMEGGIRVGVCGKAALEGDAVIGVSEITGLIVRIPHPVRVDSGAVMERICPPGGRIRSLLLYAIPGVGKTTLLRAIARELSSPAYGRRTVVVDTREELAYTLEDPQLQLDILAGYPRQLGIEIAVRSLCAQVILCDEIGDDTDAKAILSAANCGVPIIASAHADGLEELLARPAIRQLHDAHAFSCYTGLQRNGEGRFCYRFADWRQADMLLGQFRAHL
ncbi:MAG: AAA family ATPase [Clostridia bacterium]|nr:AAA family ATPase [Clostridia bacterium]